MADFKLHKTCSYYYCVLRIPSPLKIKQESICFFRSSFHAVSFLPLNIQGKNFNFSEYMVITSVKLI